MAYAADFGTGQVVWSMIWFVLFFIWIWLLIVVFADIFRSQDLSGWGKALWILFVIVLPYLGVFIYLIVRGHRMSEHAEQAAAATGRRKPQLHTSRGRLRGKHRRRDSPARESARSGGDHRSRVPAGEGQGAGVTGPPARRMD